MNHLETPGSPVSEKIKTMIKFENQLSTDNLSISYGSEEYTKTSRKRSWTELKRKQQHYILISV